MSGAATAVTSTGVGGRLLLTDDPDPRVLQGVFALLFALDFACAPSAEPTDPGLVAGARGLPRAGRLRRGRPDPVGTRAAVPGSWALPVLDIAALGMSRLSEDGSSAGILVVLPALWLGRQFGRAGRWWPPWRPRCCSPCPVWSTSASDDANLARSLMIPAVAGWAALAIASGARADPAPGAPRPRSAARELAEALDTIDHQRRFADAILDTVDVGLVLLDRTGAYQSMNKRHGDFMRLAYPGRPRGQGRPARARLRRRRRHAARPRGDADLPRRPGRGVRRLPDLGRRRPAHQAGAVGLGAHRPRRPRAVRRRGAGLQGRHRLHAGAAGQGRVRRLGLPRAADAADLDHGVRRPAARRSRTCRRAQASHLEVVARNTDRLRRLVADLLHTAQVDDGPMHVVRTRTDLAAIVRDVGRGRPAGGGRRPGVGARPRGARDAWR